MKNALVVDSPVGPLRIVESAGSIVEVSFAPENGSSAAAPAAPGAYRSPDGAGPLPEKTARELADYFAGKLKRFTVPVLPEGTEFERLVWAELLTIPWGTTRTYGEIAVAIGKPNASRAVGRAIGANPVAIIIPCHRVIGKDGSLTGYAGGLDRKKTLLAIEGFDGMYRER
jgi:methylated-DNA-[protein]-cysteine S-methyltransferase